MQTLASWAIYAPVPSPSLYTDAKVYDVLHAPGTAAEVRGLEAVERRFVRTRRRRPTWLEPACGTGRCLAAAARRGRRVAGFDLDPGMIDYARARSIGGARLFVADMTRFAHELEPASIDLAFCLINTIRHLPSDAAMLAHLREIESVLAPGGVYVVGLSLCAYGLESPSEDTWIGARGRLRVTQVVQFEPPDRAARSERVVSHLTIERPSGTEHRDSTYTLRAYDTRQWTRLIARSPLTIAAAIDERANDVAMREPGYHWFVLRRP